LAELAAEGDLEQATASEAISSELRRLTRTLRRSSVARRLVGLVVLQIKPGFGASRG
jgi:hypothetical protein